MSDAVPPRLDLRTTGHLLRQSSATFAAALPPLLLASLLLLFFRSALLAGTLHLTAVVDEDPAVRSLLSRLSAADPPSAAPRHAPPPPRRRSPFFHLTRVGTLDEDFFSDSNTPSDRLSFRRPRSNSTLFFNPVPLFLVDDSLGFPKTPKPVKIRVPEFSDSPVLFSFPDERNDAGNDESDRDRPIELRIFGRGLDLGRQDAIVILYLLSLLSSTHTLAIVGFMLFYSFSLGIVFFAVTSSHLGKQISLTGTIYSGARLGIRRLTGSIFLRWSLRDALIQFLCICFFSDIRDQSKLFKLFIRVKLMPLSLTAPFPLVPWFGPLDAELSMLFYMWAALDMVSSIALAVNPFVVIMDHNVRRRGGDVVKEGCYLVSVMLSQAICIKCLETLACGKVGRWALMRIGGRFFAMVFQSVAEVYFLVVWLIFYFAARCKDGELEGRRFGRGDLEDCISGLR